MKLGVIGYGVVGKHMTADIERAGHEAVVFDVANIARHNASRDEINACAAAFVCVSTPSLPSGACDVSAIDDVFDWLSVPAIIRSTVPPGTTAKLLFESSLTVAFCPEFIGEGVNAPYGAMRQPPFLIVGCEPDDQEWCAAVLHALYNSECELVFVSAVSAEVAKYAENYFLALKVSWANDLFRICAQTGADFPAMMAAVTHDYRIGRSHTHVDPTHPGWDGRCLPKDTAALLELVGAETAPLLDAMIHVNKIHRGEA